MTFQTTKGMTIYEPCDQDSDTTHGLFQWLKDYQFIAGSDMYDQVLEIYKLERVEWELEMAKCIN